MLSCVISVYAFVSALYFLTIMLRVIFRMKKVWCAIYFLWKTSRVSALYVYITQIAATNKRNCSLRLDIIFCLKAACVKAAACNTIYTLKYDDTFESSVLN